MNKLQHNLYCLMLKRHVIHIKKCVQLFASQIFVGLHDLRIRKVTMKTTTQLYVKVPQCFRS